MIPQWRRELSLHITAGIFGTMLLHQGGMRLEGLGIESFLQEAGVVLTTYEQVRSSFNSQKRSEDTSTTGRTQQTVQCDPLHQAYFYRIVLDEAQKIKNHTAQTSRACQTLKGTHRWVVSGTPIMNKPEDLHACFRFLQPQSSATLGSSRKDFCKKNDPE